MSKFAIYVLIMILLLSACNKKTSYGGFANEEEAYRSFERYYTSIPATCPGKGNYRFDAGVRGYAYWVQGDRWMFRVYLVKEGDEAGIREMKYTYAKRLSTGEWERLCPIEQDYPPDYEPGDFEEPPEFDDDPWP